MIPNKRFIKINTIFSFGGEKLIVVGTNNNEPSCSQCVFSDWERRKKKLGRYSCYLHRLDCSAFSRKDKHHVVFKAYEQI